MREEPGGRSPTKSLSVQVALEELYGLKVSKVQLVGIRLVLTRAMGINREAVTNTYVMDILKAEKDNDLGIKFSRFEDLADWLCRRVVYEVSDHSRTVERS